MVNMQSRMAMRAWTLTPILRAPALHCVGIRLASHRHDYQCTSGNKHFSLEAWWDVQKCLLCVVTASELIALKLVVLTMSQQNRPWLPVWWRWSEWVDLRHWCARPRCNPWGHPGWTAPFSQWWLLYCLYRGGKNINTQNTTTTFKPQKLSFLQKQCQVPLVVHLIKLSLMFTCLLYRDLWFRILC